MSETDFIVDFITDVYREFGDTIQVYSSDTEISAYYIHATAKSIADETTRHKVENGPIAKVYQRNDLWYIEFLGYFNNYVLRKDNSMLAVRQALNYRLVNAGIGLSVNFLPGFYENGLSYEDWLGSNMFGFIPVQPDASVQRDLNYMKEQEEKKEKKENGFTNVVDMLNDMGIDSTGVEQKIQSRRISTGMLIARAKADLTQKDLAEKLGESVAWVKHVEETEDAMLTLGEIERYYAALGIKAKIGVSVILGTEEKLY